MMLKFSGLALGLAAALSLAGCNTPEGQGAAGGAVSAARPARCSARPSPAGPAAPARRRRRRRDRRDGRLRVGAAQEPGYAPPPRRCAENYYDYYGRQRVPGLVLTAEAGVSATVLARQPAGRRNPALAQSRRAARFFAAEQHRLALYRNADGGGRDRSVAKSRGRSVEPLCRRGGRPRSSSSSPEIAPGLACGRLLLARRARHEFGVGRYRDLQRRPRRRPAGFSR